MIKSTSCLFVQIATLVVESGQGADILSQTAYSHPGRGHHRKASLQSTKELITHLSYL